MIRKILLIALAVAVVGVLEWGLIRGDMKLRELYLRGHNLPPDHVVEYVCGQNFKSCREVEKF